VNLRNADGQRLFRRAVQNKAARWVQTESSNMGDESATLAIKIQTTEEKIEKLERHVVNNDFAGTPYDDRAEAKAALKALTAEKVALQNEKVALQNEKVALQNEKVELLKKENLLLQQQQQTGAGTSMLPVRLALVIFLLQRSCCMLANLVAFRECNCLDALPASTAVAYCSTSPLLRHYMLLKIACVAKDSSSAQVRVISAANALSGVEQCAALRLAVQFLSLPVCY
jgi:hypothetical protein